MMWRRFFYRHCTVCHHEGEVAPFALYLRRREEAGPSDCRGDALAADAAVEARGRVQPLCQGTATQRPRDSDYSALGEQRRAGRQPSAAAESARYTNDWKLGQPDLVVRVPRARRNSSGWRGHVRVLRHPMNLPGDRSFARWSFGLRTGAWCIMRCCLPTPGAPSRRPHYPCFGTIGLLPTLGLGGWSPGMGPDSDAGGRGAPAGGGFEAGGTGPLPSRWKSRSGTSGSSVSISPIKRRCDG